MIAKETNEALNNLVEAVVIRSSKAAVAIIYLGRLRWKQVSLMGYRTYKTMVNVPCLCRAIAASTEGVVADMAAYGSTATWDFINTLYSWGAYAQMSKQFQCSMLHQTFLSMCQWCNTSDATGSRSG